MGVGFNCFGRSPFEQILDKKSGMQFVQKPPVGAAAALSFSLMFGGLIVK